MATKKTKSTKPVSKKTIKRSSPKPRTALVCKHASCKKVMMTSHVGMTDTEADQILNEVFEPKVWEKTPGAYQKAIAAWESKKFKK